MIFTEPFKQVKNKTIPVDIDGTICYKERTFDRPLAVPLEGAVEVLKLLKQNNNTFILWTASGWEQYRITTK